MDTILDRMGVLLDRIRTGNIIVAEELEIKGR